MKYTPPTNLLFNFSDAGYSPPDFDKLLLDFGAGEGVRQLRVEINCMVLERDALKRCETYVVGYDDYNTQILRHSCTYLGIRDLNFYLYVLSSSNLSGYIKSTTRAEDDLNAILKGFFRESDNLPTAIKGWLVEQTKNLPSYLKTSFPALEDLGLSLAVFQHQQEDFRNIIKGWSVASIKDLYNTIKPWRKEEELDIPAYIKTAIAQQEDLLTIVYKIFQRQSEDVGFLLHGWQTANLQKIIQALHIGDLSATIRATYFSDIQALLYAIQPVDLGGDLTAWATKDLVATLSIGYGPGDLPVILNSIDPVDLKIILLAKKGFNVISDLNVTMTNLSVTDLSAFLNVMSFTDLNVYLNSLRHTLDLGFEIYPKVVFVRYNVNVSFLEHRDLAVIVNFPCFGSDFRNLSAFLEAKNKSDLHFNVFGYDSSNIVDLGFSINSYDYIAQNAIQINHFNSVRPASYIDLSYTKKAMIYAMDTISLFSAERSFTDLPVSITGAYLQRDLRCYIRAYSNRHYDSPTVLQRFIALKLKNNEEDFRRYVELTFNSYANSYYYFSGNQRAYKEFSNDHWVVKVEGYKMLPQGAGFEKEKVNRKYIFNLRNYNSIDEAIRDMVDRVTLLKSSDLNVFINAETTKISNLGMSIFARRVFKTNRTLSAIVKAGQRTNANLFSTIVPTQLQSNTNLAGSINGIDYTGPTDGVVDFDFVGTGDTPPVPTDADFDFIFEGNTD